MRFHFFWIFHLVFSLLPNLACATSPYAATDHYDGKRFYNQDRSIANGKSFFTVLKWQLTKERKTWPSSYEPNASPNFNRVLTAGLGAVTWINHATELIQFAGLNVLTDPVFSERVSPFSWIGPKRVRSPGAQLKDLPKVHVVVISHNHYDHMNLESLKSIFQRDSPVFLVPLGNKKYLESAGIKNVIELDWWQSHQSAGGGVITLVPMQHWSARWLWDKSEALWGGYMIEANGLKVLFAGDTGYGPQFKEIKEKLGIINLSLIPIGAYEPRWFMKDNHMDPAEALQAHLDLDSKLSLGMHFGTFQLSDEGYEDPVLELEKAKESKPGINFITIKNGETLFFNSMGKVD